MLFSGQVILDSIKVYKDVDRAGSVFRMLLHLGQTMPLPWVHRSLFEQRHVGLENSQVEAYGVRLFRYIGGGHCGPMILPYPIMSM